MGVIVVTSGRRVAIPAVAAGVNGAVDPLSPYRFSPEFVPPHGKMPEGEFSAWWNPMMPGPRIGLHSPKDQAVPKVGCGRKGGRKASLAHSFRHIMNKLRAALGLPVIHHHHNSNLQKAKHYRLKVTENGFVEQVDASSSKSFFTRFERAMRSLR
jgi:hypothetical protein